MAQERIESVDEDRIAIPEARIVKYKYLFDYYDTKDNIMLYIKKGNRKHMLKAVECLLSLYMQIRHEFRASELKGKKSKYPDISKLEIFIENRKKIPTYSLLIRCFYQMQEKLKSMKILDITFPEADIGKDFRRSW